MPATRVETVRLIVADDLTGAADACATLVSRGFTGLVLPDLDAAGSAAASDRALIDRADVVAISTDTRRRPESAAAARVRRAAEIAGRSRDGGVFTKIDSTLRGHVGVEIAAALDTFACTHALVAPSFPAMGRRVVAGSLLVSGPGAPAPCDIPALLHAQGLPNAVVVSRPGSDTAAPASDPALQGLTTTAVLTAIERGRADGARIFVVDAESDDDLRAIVAAGHAAGGRPLWVGSAGLAAALGAGSRPRDHGPTPLPQPTGGRHHGTVLLCIGSTHPVTRAQQNRVLAERSVHLVDAASAATLCTLTLDAFVGLVLSGGDTATDACAALGVTAIELGGEVASGVPWGILRGGRAAGLPVVLKSGGFGHSGTLVEVVDFLSNELSTRAGR
jgi:uncharacterized protein YgbK (DUF1537 family)